MYKVVNPSVGGYVDANDEITRDELLAKFAWEFYMLHTHDKPYTVVTLDGENEVWTSPSGEKMLSPKEINDQVLAFVK